MYHQPIPRSFHLFRLFFYPNSISRSYSFSPGLRRRVQVYCNQYNFVHGYYVHNHRKYLGAVLASYLLLHISGEHSTNYNQHPATGSDNRPINQCPVPQSYIKFISVIRIFWVPWKVHNLNELYIWVPLTKFRTDEIYLKKHRFHLHYASWNPTQRERLQGR